MSRIVFFDLEVDKKPEDIGAVDNSTNEFHSTRKSEFLNFLKDAEYLCGHNIFDHDLHYIKTTIEQSNVRKFIDTLYWSPLLFPNNPYHALGKQYKIINDSDTNNPLFDSKLARRLLNDEVDAFDKLDSRLKSIYFWLLGQNKNFINYTFGNNLKFKHFFEYVGYSPQDCSFAKCIQDIKTYFTGKICQNADIESLVADNKTELAYSLAIINATEQHSITPPWVLRNFPRVENIVFALRSTKCLEGCDYCNTKLDPQKQLFRLFGYSNFRNYDGEPLQQQAATSALLGKSLLAIFPTGGGKSIAFQLPALVQGEVLHGLTVVISPLQSLMKDQVDNLASKSITEAVAINSSLDPIDKKDAMQRVESGQVSLLYLSPESLRNKSIETLLLKRTIVRFVIDEAHCFSSWGQDFRVDYLFIGDCYGRIGLS